MFAVSLEPEIERRLQALVDRSGRSKEEHIRVAILDHLEEMEDLQIARERLQQPARRWSMEEAEQQLGVEG
jgi:RHH-type rel operon transcriptional repressor/antitoxin RelB